jgi:DeoR/GlpR family transcriptional regulator of sugar metabolism
LSPAIDASTELFRAGGAGLAAGFCLDCAGLLTELLDEDVVPTVLVLGILSANVSADSRAATAAPDGALPYDAINRQAVSIYRLARNLSLPYETARRHVARLIKKGVCARVGDGLTIDPGVLPAPRSLVCVEEVWRLASQLRDDLLAMGQEAPAPDPAADHSEKRRVGRLANELFLAGLKIVVDATATDLVTALIFLAIARANQADGGPDEIPPDERSIPVSVYALSRKLRMPYETVRRHVSILLGEGLCRKVPAGGLIVSLAVLRAGPIQDASAMAWGLMSDFITAAFGPIAKRTAA